jgi:hypothetical protein
LWPRRAVRKLARLRSGSNMQTYGPKILHHLAQKAQWDKKTE